MLESTVCHTLFICGSLTSEQIADITEKERSSITPRMSELERNGVIKRTGEFRKGKSGYKRIVWALTPAGMTTEFMKQMLARLPDGKCSYEKYAIVRNGVLDVFKAAENK